MWKGNGYFRDCEKKCLEKTKNSCQKITVCYVWAKQSQKTEEEVFPAFKETFLSFFLWGSLPSLVCCVLGAGSWVSFWRTMTSPDTEEGTCNPQLELPAPLVTWVSIPRTAVFVVCCHEMHYHTLTCLEQHKCIISWFVWARGSWTLSSGSYRLQ